MESVEDNSGDFKGYQTFKGDIVELSDSDIFISSGQHFRIVSGAEVENVRLTELAIGQRVIIKAESNNGALEADEIWVVSGESLVVRSTINDIRADDMEIEVLGRDFSITDYTVFVDQSSAQIRSMSVDDLSIGDNVKVISTSNLHASDDDFFAAKVTRFDAQQSAVGTTTFVKDELQSLGDDLFTLLGIDIVVNVSTEFYYDQEERYITAGEFFSLASVGDEVEVILTRLENGTNLAISVELDEDSNDELFGGSVKLEGIISSGLVDNQFELNGRMIRIDTNTDIDYGNASDLVEGALVEVRIKEMEDFLLALEIDFEGSNYNGEPVRSDDNDREVEFSAQITELIDRSIVVVGNVTVVINEGTRFYEGSASDIAVGETVGVDGYVDSEGRVIAYYIDFEREDNIQFEIEGVINEKLNDSEFFINDQRVLLLENVRFDNGNVLRLQVGVRVEVEGQFDGNRVFIGREVYFEDDYD